MDAAYHYPPELLNLLVDTIPLLCRSKPDVVTFFRGAGVPQSLLGDLVQRVQARDGIKKHEIVRTLLERLNERGDATLRERREVVKRVVEFVDFSACWPDDAVKARGLVAAVRDVVNVKDSFTRMRQEKDEERKQRQETERARLAELQRKQAALSEIQQSFRSLFTETDPWKRGKALEGVLNRLFAHHRILVREAMTLKGDEKQGVVEQLDGVIELDGHVYLVEMKWWDKPVGPGEVSPHLVRVFSRADARGLFISSSGYTDAAVTTTKQALVTRVAVLAELVELSRVIDTDGDLVALLRNKVHAAIVERNPLWKT